MSVDTCRSPIDTPVQAPPPPHKEGGQRFQSRVVRLPARGRERPIDGFASLSDSPLHGNIDDFGSVANTTLASFHGTERWC